MLLNSEQMKAMEVGLRNHLGAGAAVSNLMGLLTAVNDALGPGEEPLSDEEIEEGMGEVPVGTEVEHGAVETRGAYTFAGVAVADGIPVDFEGKRDRKDEVGYSHEFWRQYGNSKEIVALLKGLTPLLHVGELPEATYPETRQPPLVYDLTEGGAYNVYRNACDSLTSDVDTDTKEGEV